MKTSFITLLMVGLCGLSLASGSDYVAIEEALSEKGNYRLHKAVASLEQQFNRICGDTYCEGDYSNLTPLSFDCSIEKNSRLVGSCNWKFAGSYVRKVDPKTGAIEYAEKFFNCSLPIKGSLKELMVYLAHAEIKSEAEGLELSLPGSDKTLMDVLSGCL